MNNPIVKLFGGLILFFIFVFFIWFFMAHLTYNDLSNVHLDVKATFNHLNVLTNNKFISGDTLAKTFKQFRQSMNTLYDSGIFTSIGQEIGFLPKDTSYALGLLFSLLDPLQNIAYVVIGGGYIIVMVLELVLITLNGIVGLYEFLVNPVFIVVNPVSNNQVVLEKAKYLFGFAFPSAMIY